jgi:hypothetical protein
MSFVFLVSMVYLVFLVYLVYFVKNVWIVRFVETSKRQSVEAYKRLSVRTVETVRFVNIVGSVENMLKAQG